MVVTSASNIVKIGSSTISIKQSGVPVNENKHVVVTTSDPPPLAPLSTQNKAPAIVHQTISINPNTQEKILVSPVSQKLTANKMLVDLLDKKAHEPPVFATTSIKRKTEMESEIPAKKIDMEAQRPDQIVSPSPKAADLYGKIFLRMHFKRCFFHNLTRI
jgi:hypothetical protein